MRTTMSPQKNLWPVGLDPILVPIRKAPVLAFSYQGVDNKDHRKPMMEVDLRPLHLSPVSLAEATRMISTDLENDDPSKIILFELDAVAQ